MLVPSTVIDEVVVRGAGLVGSREVAAAGWLEVVPVEDGDPDVLTLLGVLDRGEAAALTLARRQGAELVLIDDRRGRAVAERLQLRVEGTLGCLVRAKRAGELAEVAPILGALVDAGFWISAEVQRRVLDAVGEAAAEGR